MNDFRSDRGRKDQDLNQECVLGRFFRRAVSVDEEPKRRRKFDWAELEVLLEANIRRQNWKREQWRKKKEGG